MHDFYLAKGSGLLDNYNVLLLVMSIKNRTNASFSVQSKILSKLKALILQMRYQKVHFAVEIEKF